MFWPSVGTVIGVMGGIGLLTLALRTLPVSVGYPIWVGAGALGVVAFGWLVFGEEMGLLKVASVTLIALNVIGLKLSTFR